MNKLLTTSLIREFEEKIQNCSFVVGEPVHQGDAKLAIILSFDQDEDGPYYGGAVCRPAYEPETLNDIDWQLVSESGDKLVEGKLKKRGCLRIPIDSSWFGKNVSLNWIFEQPTSADLDAGNLRKMASLFQMILSGDYKSDDSQVVRELDALESGRVGMRSVDASWELPLATSASSESELPELTELVEIHGDNVHINCREDEIPHGLCRLYMIERDSGTVISFLPQLNFLDGAWAATVKLSAIVGHPPRKGVKFQIKWLQVANDDSRDWFQTDEVRKFVSELDDSSKQCERAKAFLG